MRRSREPDNDGQKWGEACLHEEWKRKEEYEYILFGWVFQYI